MRILALSCIVLAGCAARLDSVQSGIAADGAITVAAVSSGMAAEANPIVAAAPVLGMASIVGRAVLASHLSEQQEPQRTVDLAALDSITWGAVASNVLVAAGASTPFGLGVGLLTGASLWMMSEEERLFASVCAYERASNPNIQCIYRRR